MNKHSLWKTVLTWLEADVWELFHMERGFVNDQDNILLIIDGGFVWK